MCMEPAAHWHPEMLLHASLMQTTLALTHHSLIYTQHGCRDAWVLLYATYRANSHMRAVWTLWSFSPIKLGLGGLTWRAELWGGSCCRPPLSAKARTMPVFSHFPCVFGNRLSLHSWKQAGEQHWCHLQPARGLCEVLGLGYIQAAPGTFK